MQQVTDLADIRLDFQYTGTIYDDLTDLQLNVLEYQMAFQSMDWTKAELENISKQLVETGRIFAENQGFSPVANFIDTGVTLDSELALKHPAEYAAGPGATGRLYHGIKSEVQGQRVRFYNDARNDRGQPYAAHMEYGFHDRGGNLVPARPFMRPAFYAVSEGSKGNFRGIMKGLLDNIWTTRGYNGIAALTFGKAKGSQSMFWKNPSIFGGKVGGMSRISQLRGSNFRQKMTATKNIKARKTGYNLRANHRDYHKTRLPLDSTLRHDKKWGGRMSGRTAQSERERAKKHQEMKERAESKKQRQRERQRAASTGGKVSNFNPENSSNKVGTYSSSKQKETKDVDWAMEHERIQQEISSYSQGGYASDYLGDYDDFY